MGCDSQHQSVSFCTLLQLPDGPSLFDALLHASRSSRDHIIPPIKYLEPAGL